MQAVPMLPSDSGICIFIGGCAAVVLAQIGTSAAIVRTMHKIAGNVVPADAAEAYAAGYAVGAVRGEQRQAERRVSRRGRAAERSRERRNGGTA